MKGSKAKPQKTSGEKRSKEQGNSQYFAHLKTKLQTQNEIEICLSGGVIMR